MEPVLPGTLRPTVEALADALVPATEAIPERAAQIALWERIERWAARWPRNRRMAFILALRGLDRWARIRHRHPFHELSSEDRGALVAAWSGSRLGRPWLRALGLVLLPAFFGAERLRENLGDRAHERPTAAARPAPTSAFEALRSDPHADVVIVGSGPGAAPLALELSLAGVRVIVLEAGPYVAADAVPALPLEAITAMVDDAGTRRSEGSPRIVLPTARALGGTSGLSAGLCVRPPDAALNRWSVAGLDGPGLAPYFERIEERLGVRPTPRSLFGHTNESLARTCATMRWSHDAAPRAAAGCEGSHRCAVGCPSGSAHPMDRALLPLAATKGARIVVDAEVERVVVDQDRAVGVIVRVGGERLRIDAGTVVVSAGALNTPPLLWRSGLRHRALGQHLVLHPSVQVRALFPGQNGLAPPAVAPALLIDQFRDRGLLLHGAQGPIELGAAWLAGHPPAEIAEAMGHAREITAVAASLADQSVGAMRRTLGPKAAVHYDLSHHDAAALCFGVERICELLLTAGAKRLYLPTSRVPALEWWEDPGARLREAKLRPGDLDVVAMAPAGTCALGDDPEESPLDADLAFRGVAGLYVCDASVLPSSLPVPPQATMLALSTRLAEHLLLGRGMRGLVG